MSSHLELPDVTLVSIETRQHELMRLAIEDSVSKTKFGDVLTLTDKPELYEDISRVVEVPDWPDKLGWSRCLWQEVTPHLRTSHWLSIQWDSWVFDPTMWRDDYLQYDYVGSPWWYKDFRNVGNGGFSLRSTRLHRYLRKHRDRFPCVTSIDDDLLCRKYRPELEKAGFVWAPQKIARDFSFEMMIPEPLKTYGFHGMFNWHLVCNEDQLMQRATIANRSDYIKGRMWDSFCRNNPKIIEKLSAA